MKKTYMRPATVQEKIELTNALLTMSAGGGSGDPGDAGGGDPDDAAGKLSFNLWDDSFEEDE